jgi:hypothetical protein
MGKMGGFKGNLKGQMKQCSNKRAGDIVGLLSVIKKIKLRTRIQRCMDCWNPFATVLVR